MTTALSTVAGDSTASAVSFILDSTAAEIISGDMRFASPLIVTSITGRAVSPDPSLTTLYCSVPISFCSFSSSHLRGPGVAGYWRSSPSQGRRALWARRGARRGGPAADDALHVVKRVARVGELLVLGGLADQALAVGGEGHPGGRDARTLVILEHLRTALQGTRTGSGAWQAVVPARGRERDVSSAWPARAGAGRPGCGAPGDRSPPPTWR